MLYIHKIRCHVGRIRFKKWDLSTGLWSIWRSGSCSGPTLHFTGEKVGYSQDNGKPVRFGRVVTVAPNGRYLIICIEKGAHFLEGSTFHL